MRYVNVLPRPLQQPHPPVWIPGGGSVETWDFCSQNDFVYAALSYYGHLMAKETVGGYWRQVEANGKDPNPYRLAFLQFIGVADTDQEAYRLYKEPAEYFFNRSLHVYPGLRRPARLRHRGVGPGSLQVAGARRRPGEAGQARPDVGRDGGEGLRRHRQPRHRPRDARRGGHDVQLRPPADDAAVRQHERRADPLQQRAVRRQGRPGAARHVQRVRGPLVAGRTQERWRDGRRSPARSTCPGSPDTRRTRRRWTSSPTPAGTSSSPSSPVSTGAPGSAPPDDHLGWLTVVWDALDATGALPCPVVGASVGGMLAADLAVFRPEAVTALALLAPFGIFDEDNPGLDVFAVPTARTDGAPLRQGRARAVRRALRPPRPRRRPGRPLPQRRRRGKLDLATRRSRSGPPPPSRQLPDARPVGGRGRAVAGGDGAAVGRGRRRPWKSSPGPAICSNGMRPARSAAVSSSSWDPDHDRSQLGDVMSLVDQAEFHFFHFFPYTNLPSDHAHVRVAVGRLPQLQLRPADRARPLHPLPVGDGPRRPARLRRARAQRAPQHPVLDEPGAEPHGGGADPPDEGHDQRVRDAAEPRLPEPPRRGVRDARRDVGRAAADRLPARHRDGVLGQLGQPGDGPGPLPRVDRRDPALLDRGRAAELRRRLLHLPLPQPVAQADAEAASRSATSSAPARPRRSSSPPSSASATPSCSSRRRRS